MILCQRKILRLTRVTSFLSKLFRSDVSDDKRANDRVRGFATAQFTGGMITACVVPFYIVMVGWPGLIEWIAFCWLMSPLLLAFAPRMGASLELSHTLSLLNMTGLVTFLAAYTGGIESFLVAWFVIIPIEAALSGNRKSIYTAITFAGLGVIVLSALTYANLLPSAHVIEETKWLLFAGATFAALVYAGAVAMTAQQYHKQAEIDALSGEARYKFLAENALDMIIRFHPDGSIAYVSQACFAILGYEQEEIKALDLAALIHPADVKKARITLSQAIYFGSDASIEFRMRHKDGEYVWIEMRCHPVISSEDMSTRRSMRSRLSLKANGAVVAPSVYEVIAVARDVSDAKMHLREMVQAREEAETANSLKTRFLANVSHELRTPLNAIIGFSDMMRRELFGELGNDKYLEYSELINDSGVHLLDLINDLLDMSKIEAGKYELERSSLFVPIIMEACLRLVRLQAQKAKVKLNVDLPAHLPYIEADPRACKQMLLNLLSNAIKFTPAGGQVTLSAHARAGYLELAVTDTGVGISPEDLERLGKPFEQVAQQQDLAQDGYGRAQSGTGLGLALVQSLAELHSGQVDIISEVGVGTTVKIVLPMVASQNENIEGAVSHEVPAHTELEEEHQVLEEATVVETNLESEESEDKDVPPAIDWPPLKGAA